MDDLISRQAAIEHIEANYRKWGDEYDARQILGDLEDMPTAEPERKKGENDLISRQAAIDAATHGNPQTAWQRIEALPSVQPENTILKAINNIRALTGCEELIITDKNSMRTWDANGVEYKLYPERKKGKWIYLTGLDAFECSCCGRQMVRNIFDYCPWCGAEMVKGDEDETD